MNIYLEEANKVFISEDDTMYALLSDTGECIFTIEGEFDDGGEIVSYTAYNSMGAGSWMRTTLKECVVAIEEAYSDTVIDKTDDKVLTEKNMNHPVPSLLEDENENNNKDLSISNNL